MYCLHGYRRLLRQQEKHIPVSRMQKTLQRRVDL